MIIIQKMQQDQIGFYCKYAMPTKNVKLLIHSVHQRDTYNSTLHIVFNSLVDAD